MGLVTAVLFFMMILATVFALRIHDHLSGRLRQRDRYTALDKVGSVIARIVAGLWIITFGCLIVTALFNPSSLPSAFGLTAIVLGSSFMLIVIFILVSMVVHDLSEKARKQ